MSDNQVQTDAEDETTAVDPLGAADSTQSGTNALDDWHASIASLNLDDSPEPEQGEQPAEEVSDDEPEQEEIEEVSEEQEPEPEQISEEQEPEDEQHGSRDSMRPRLKDPLDIAVAQLAKAKGISLIEAAKVIDSAQATPARADAEDTEQTAETVDSVQARIEELEDMEAQASTALEFETANEHRKEANKLRSKLIDLKIAEVQEKSQAEANAERKFLSDYVASESKALKFYPDAAKADSPLRKEIDRLEAEMLELGDPLYHSEDKPWILARDAAKNLGIRMTKEGTEPKKTVQHRPMQPAGGNARTTTTDPAKKASEAIDGIGSMRDFQDLVARI